MTIHTGFFAAVIYENGETGSSFPVSWPRADNAHVQVLLNDVELVLDTDYTSDNVGITLSGVPLAISDTLVISRLTPRDNRRIDWGDGVPFVSKALDAEGVNIHYIQQELADQISMAEPGKVASTFEKHAIAVTAGVQVLQIPEVFISIILLIDGVIQFETDDAYTFDGTLQTLTLAEPLQGNEVVEVWLNAVFLGPSAAAGTDNTLVGLYDVESSYIDRGGRTLKVKDDELGVEFVRDTQALYTTVDAALAADIEAGQILNIKETVTSDASLFVWDVVLTSTVTVNKWNIRQSVFDASLSIVLRGAVDLIIDREYAPARIIAHRGFQFSAVAENTILAVSAAHEHGADGVEFDLQTDIDGVIWCYHDPDLTPDTQLTGRIQDSTTAYIEGAIYNNTTTKYGNVGMTKLSDMLEYCRGKKLFIHPEMKWDWSSSQIDALVVMLDTYGYNNNNCYLSDVDVGHLVQVRQTSSTVKVGYGFNLNFADAFPGLELLSTLNNTFINWWSTALLDEPELFFPYCADRNIEVTGWVISDVIIAARLRRYGCNIFICDVPLGDRL